MKIALKELREQEFMNVEKTYYDIASILRDIGEIRFYKVFGVTYLAYLAEMKNQYGKRTFRLYSKQFAVRTVFVFKGVYR